MNGAFQRLERVARLAFVRRDKQSSVFAATRMVTPLGSAVFGGFGDECASGVRPRGERARRNAHRPQTRHARRVSRRVEAAAAVLAQTLPRDVHDDGDVTLPTTLPRRRGLAASSSPGIALGRAESRGRAERASSARLVFVVVCAPRVGWTHRRGDRVREAVRGVARARRSRAHKMTHKSRKTLIEAHFSRSTRRVVDVSGLGGFVSQSDREAPRECSPRFRRYLRLRCLSLAARAPLARWVAPRRPRAPSARASRASRRSPLARPFREAPPWSSLPPVPLAPAVPRAGSPRRLPLPPRRRSR